MAIDREAAPEVIGKLLDWLSDEGFAVVAQQASGRANQFARFTGADRVVTITADRGAWSLSAGLEGMDSEFHPDEWEAWLDGFDLAGELSTLEHQVDFLTSRWSCALAAARTIAHAEDEIRAIGRDYMYRRFGFRP